MGCIKVVHVSDSLVRDLPVLGSAEAAWILRLDQPLAEAAPADISPSLAGLSFAVKDNIDVAGLPTTAACPGFAHAAAASAVVVERLLHAGASLAGKTNLDQFACGLNGTRSAYGAVPNAFDIAMSAVDRAPARPTWWPPARSTSRWAPTPPAPAACLRA